MNQPAGAPPLNNRDRKEKKKKATANGLNHKRKRKKNLAEALFTKSPTSGPGGEGKGKTTGEAVVPDQERKKGRETTRKIQDPLCHDEKGAVRKEETREKGGGERPPHMDPRKKRKGPSPIVRKKKEAIPAAKGGGEKKKKKKPEKVPHSNTPKPSEKRGNVRLISIRPQKKRKRGR